jgi:hypothetical protein
MAKVLSAVQYPGKTVITVCLNPDAPAFVHADRTPHPPTNVNGCAAGIDGDGLPDYGTPGCTKNWQVQEFVWRRQHMNKPDPNMPGSLVAKVDADYLADIQAALEPNPALTTITSLVGRVA